MPWTWLSPVEDGDVDWTTRLVEPFRLVLDFVQDLRKDPIFDRAWKGACEAFDVWPEPRTTDDANQRWVAFLCRIQAAAEGALARHDAARRAAERRAHAPIPRTHSPQLRRGLPRRVRPQPAGPT